MFYKRLTALLLTVAMLLSMLTLFVGAASSEDEALTEANIFNGGHSLSCLAVNGKVQTLNYVYYVHNGREIPTYCVNPSDPGVPQKVGSGESIQYIIEERASDPKIMGIVANGYPTKGLGELGLQDKYEGYYATKIALWCHIIPEWSINAVTVNPNLSGEELAQAQRVLAAAKKIHQYGTWWTEVPTAALTTSVDRELAYPVTIDGKSYKQQIFTVTSPTFVSGRVANVAFQDPDTVPAGTRIVNMENEDITQVAMEGSGMNISGQFKILYPADAIADQEGSVQVRLQAETYQYGVFYATCAETNTYGEIQDYLCDTDPTKWVAVDALSKYGTSEIPDDPETGLKIIKVQEGTQTPLAGAIFEIKGPNGDVIGQYSTDTSGTIVVPLTISGTYTVTEIVPPENHTLSKNPTQTVTVSYGKVATVTFENAPYGSLRVEKLSDTGDHLQGVTIQIRHIETGTTYTQKTEAGGAAVFTELQPGAYEVREVSGIEGWLPDTETVVTVSVATGETVTATLKNKELPGLRILKYDRQTMVAMPNVTFEVFKDNQSIGTYKTNQLGEIFLPELEPGTYRVVELHTGDDEHIVEVMPQEIELKAGSGILELVFFNSRKPGLRLVKVDAANPSKVIPNAVFEICSVDGSFGPQEFTTDENGEIDLSKLDPGAYVVTEKSCPGYVIDEAQRIIQLDPDETGEFVFTNSIKPSLHLIKFSADGTPLGGVTFRISKIEDGSHYLDRTTNEQGEILVSDLEPGVYLIKEMATVADHILDETEYRVELFPGKTSTITIQNDKRPNLTIRKTDKDTGEPIPGVTFTLNYADGPTITTEPTGEDGTVTIENLLPGVYTVTEQSVPEGYILDTTPQQITLEPNRDATVQFQNYKRPTLTIHKVDINGNALTGAIFEVKTKAGVKIGDFPVGPDGSITIENVHLDEGYYIVTEIQAPDGYILDSTPHEVYLRPGKTTEITIENEKKPGLTIKKIDSVTGNPLKGAKFELWVSKDNTEDGTFQKLDQNYYYTDENGEIYLDKLDTGWYKVVEVEPPTGYALRDPSEQIIYVDNDKAVELIFENTPLSALIVWKFDSKTGEALEGAVFQVKYLGGTSGTGGTVIGTYKTSANGSFTVTGLEAGTYVVEEIAAPDGHVIDTAPQTVFISGKEQDVVQLYFGNSPKGSLLIKKIDSETREPLSDVEFMVTTSDGTVVGDANGKFVTDSAGTILIEDIDPGTTLVVKETRARDGYLLDDTPQTVKIKSGETVTLEFRNQPKGNLIINKLDSVTKAPLEGVEFQLTYSDGSYVDAEGGTLSSKGLYTTDENGQIILSGLTGTIVVTETKTIEGYTIHEETRTQTVVVNPNDTQELTFYNDPVGGVEIIKVDAADKTERLGNATFEIRKMDDALVDTVTTDKNGRVFLSLEDGSYYAVEIEAPEGYKLDNTHHYFEVKNGKTSKLTITNTAMSGIIIHKIDSTTGKGIYGVSFLLYDDSNNPIGQYTSDDQGYIYIENLESGRYYLRELENEGYILDTQRKTVNVKSGETTLVEWENTPITGQIQITKYAGSANPVTGEAAGTTLSGAVFEIVQERSGAVVDYITTDARGVAASDPLPLGRYLVREVTAPAYYQLSDQTFDVTLEYAGQILKLAAYNDPAELDVTIMKTGPKEVLAGSKITYQFTVANGSNVALSNFFWHDKLPYDIASASTLITGTYNQRLTYQVLYKTNYNGYRVLASNLLTTNTYSFSLNALPLMQGEVVTDVYFDFGTVPAGFQSMSKPMLIVSVSPQATNGYYVTNRADAGGQYLGTWETGNTAWVTIVRNLSSTPKPTLPQTGY